MCVFYCASDQKCMLLCCFQSPCDGTLERALLCRPPMHVALLGS